MLRYDSFAPDRNTPKTPPRKLSSNKNVHGLESTEPKTYINFSKNKDSDFGGETLHHYIIDGK